MFDWIPLPIYTDLFYHIMLVITLFVGIHAISFDLRNKKRITEFSYIGFILVIFVILYMGFRPVSGRYFGDMSTYNSAYANLQAGGKIESKKEFLFHYFMWFCSQFISAKQFFLLVDILYILPMYLFSKKYFQKYWFFGLFIFFASFSFWAAGTNGLRTGLATSFFIWGLCYYGNKKILMYFLFVLGFLMHNSLIITISAFVVAIFLIRKPKYIFFIWMLTIPLSLAGGSAWGVFFENLGLFEDRTKGYLTGGDIYMDQFSKTGFRWDFLLYSSTAIIAGWYFIIKKKLEDKFYIHLFGIYAIANAFWILVIEAAFSNRFAYLSWFLMGAVIIYPLAKYDMMKNQYKVLGAIVFLYFMFTYFLNVVL
ncbi:EpsG family protein [Moheibacter sp.]|uniref:EpsG family protein n=1 Tax=Moheibacter sp. TaxID=1965316 RepID=UPI003C723F46